MSVLGVVISLAAALVFYSLRCRKRFIYGLLEVAVGIAVIYFVFFPVTTSYLRLTSPLPPLYERGLAVSVGILAGIYVMVRGLDNMDQDLPPKWRSSWDRLFKGVCAIKR